MAATKAIGRRALVHMKNWFDRQKQVKDVVNEVWRLWEGLRSW